MIPYVCQLELGEEATPEALLSHCDARQKDEFASARNSLQTIDARDLPTLTAFETSLRTTQADRATGLDPFPSSMYHNHAPQLAKFYYALLLKIHIWAMEPLQFKGGVVPHTRKGRFETSQEPQRNPAPGIGC